MANISPERRQRLERERSRNSSRGSFYSTKGLTKDLIRLTPLGPEDDVGTKYVYYFINNRSFTCPEETHGKPSIVAKVRRALTKLFDDEKVGAEAQEWANTLKEARRGKWLMKIIARSDETTPKWFEAPKAVYEAAFKALDQDEEDISHSREGRDLRWSREGAGKNTEYSVRLMDKGPLAADKETRQAIIAAAAEMSVADVTKTDEEGAYDALQELLPPALWKRIKADIGGEASEGTSTKAKRASSDGDEDATDEDDAPVAKKAAKPVDADDEDEAPVAKKKVAAPVDEDDDEVPTPKKKATAPVADDEDDVPAAKAPTRRAAAANDDDDLDDEPVAPKKAAAPAKAPVDEDDEDDAPVAKKAAPAKAPVADDEDDEAPRPAKNAAAAYKVPAKKAAVDEDDE